MSNEFKNPPLWKSFKNAKNGIFASIRSSRQIRIMVVIFMFAIVAAALLPCSEIERIVILLSGFAVLAAESFNTAIEFVIDMMIREYDERARLIKDISAGAVLLLSIGVLLVGLSIYISAIVRIFS